MHQIWMWLLLHLAGIYLRYVWERYKLIPVRHPPEALSENNAH